jgi:hypothetical protein
VRKARSVVQIKKVAPVITILYHNHAIEGF